MTCDQFDELWKRLDVTVPGANALRAGLVTASEMTAFRTHANECRACSERCEKRYDEMPKRPVYDVAAAEMVEELRERSRFDEELG